MSLIVDIEKKLDNFTLRSQFETPDGIMALLGASGCGKSVTLKCIAGIMTPDRGRILLDGETLFDSEKKIDLTPQQRRVGYLFQQYALFPNMTVTQNIICGIRQGKREEKKAQAAEAIRRFRLEGLEKKYPAQLSGGQQQRVALARILVSEPRAILLDEPFSALDSFLKWNLELELSDLLSEFTGPILWVSHDLRECYRNCSAVCVIENGVSGAVTDMETLLHHPGTRGAAQLVGCRNFLPGHSTAEGVVVSGWNMTLPVKTPLQQVTIGIPDTAIAFAAEGTACTVERMIRDIGETVVLLRPAAEKEAPPLRAVLPQGMQTETGAEVFITVDPQQCILQ